MCTAITFSSKDFFFGRTLDHEQTYGEEVVISPRNLSLPFRELPALEHHHAIVGIAHVAQGYPLYYDAVNEKGLCMAGLNFHTTYDNRRIAAVNMHLEDLDGKELSRFPLIHGEDVQIINQN